ncbi:MAG: L,D-transpeptidase family protein [Planctomycetales bacterium]|nr:L,D-transpeptidase family protein [Planctomycetales bacterium]
MQTIKTGVVVALLLAVCYGAFVALNAPEADIPSELLSEFEWSPDEAAVQDLLSVEMPGGASPGGSNKPSAAGSTSGAEESAAGFDLTSNLPTIDTSHLSTPQFPDAGGGLAPAAPQASAAASAQASVPAGSNPPSVGSPLEGLTAAPADVSGLPAMPSLPQFQASDGPAVALGSGSVAKAESAPATETAKAEPQAALPTGQLVSQTRNADSSSIQLPLLDAAAATSSPSAAPQASNASESKKEPSQSPPTVPFRTAREQALALAASGKLREALQQLSPHYDSPEVTHAEHVDLVDILDALSREVIYSPRHLAAPAYIATASDTIASVAQKFQITPELLAAINGLGEAKTLLPGAQVKVLQGPFRARVSLNRGEMTLFLGDMYAGRFPISVGRDPTPTEGTYEIVDRRRDRTYYGTGGTVVAANDPRNPYGGYWLNLGQDLCIHGTPEMTSSELADAGCISLAPLDAADAYNILAQGSQVVIAP